MTPSLAWHRLTFKVALWATIALAGFGSAVWQLWNHLMPDIFGLTPIGYWQACGLMGLCWLLFGGWRWSSGSAPRGTPDRGTAPISDDDRRRLRVALGEERAT